MLSWKTVCLNIEKNVFQLSLSGFAFSYLAESILPYICADFCELLNFAISLA
jgi:hypothetical protein